MKWQKLIATQSWPDIKILDPQILKFIQYSSIGGQRNIDFIIRIKLTI